MLKSPLINELIQIVGLKLGSKKTRDRFIARIQFGNLTRDENKLSHFSVYFAPIRFSSDVPEILIGWHKKANQYLVPGGHIEQSQDRGRDERCVETLSREFFEEFSYQLPFGFCPNPFWITITRIDNSTQACKEHLDIWFAIDVTDISLGENSEFTKVHWMSLNDAGAFMTDEASQEAMLQLEKYLESSRLEKVIGL